MRRTASDRWLGVIYARVRVEKRHSRSRVVRFVEEFQGGDAELDLVAEVLVRGADFALVRERIGLQTFLDHERFPAWLDAGRTEPAQRRRN